MQRGRVGDEIMQIKQLICNNPNLTKELEKHTKPLKPDKQLQDIEKKTKGAQDAKKASENKRLESWEVWRNNLIANPIDAFATDRNEHTLQNLYEWLKAYKGRGSNGNYYAIWDKNALTKAFSNKVAILAKNSFQKYWRNSKPTLWAQIGRASCRERV